MLGLHKYKHNTSLVSVKAWYTRLTRAYEAFVLSERVARDQAKSCSIHLSSPERFSNSVLARACTPSLLRLYERLSCIIFGFCIASVDTTSHDSCTYVILFFTAKVAQVVEWWFAPMSNILTWIVVFSFETIYDTIIV